MLEGLIAWVLNNYLGKYVQLNTDQLSIALLSGKVELENLPLKKDALRNLGLPVIIKSGFIGKVLLQIPLRQIRSAPWVIAIEQLYLVASPLSASGWDHDAEDLARHEQKLSSLDNLEAKWRLKNDIQDANSTYYSSSYSSWFSYGAGLVSEIIENLQLRIQDIHIRYEDSTSIPMQPIAFGITLQSLVAQSCDSNWLPSFIHNNKSEESFKLVELQKFAVYWTNLREEESLSELSIGQLAEIVLNSKFEKNLRDYIIPSVSAQAHLKRNRSSQPLRSSAPRIGSDLLLEEVNLILNDWQYNQIVTIIRGLENTEKLRKYHLYKPILPIKEDARAWWLYAISCSCPDKQPNICRPKPTWESCLKKAKENVKYVQISKKLLINPTVALSIDEKKFKETVEWDRNFDELKILRELAMRSVDLPAGSSGSSRSAGQSMLVNWFPTWMGWYSSSESSSTPLQETSQLEGEILQVLADSAEYNTIFKRDMVFGQFSFCLKSGTLNLCTSDGASRQSVPMLELEYKNLSLSILSKPRTSSHLVELSLGALYLRDKIAQNTVFPILIGPPGLDRTTFSRSRVISPRVSFTGMGINDSEDIGDNLFYLAYEKKPPNSGCDFSLSVKSKCLDVVYQPNALRWLIEFIYSPHQRDITQSQIEAMKTRTKKELMKNWEHILEGRVVTKTSWELELDITAPQIIFVEQFSDQNSAMAVIDFGKLQLRNNAGNVEPPVKTESDTKENDDTETFLTPCSTPPVSEASDSVEKTVISNCPINETNIHNKLYDQYSLELTDMQILLGKAKDNWRYALNKGYSNLHVLDRFSISLQIERRVVYTADPQFPSLTINGNLPRLTAHLSENKIISARNLLHLITATGVPSPFKTPPTNVDTDLDVGEEDESVSVNSSVEHSKLVIMQFTVDQLSLEIQSRGRSISELQVAGVKAAFTKRSIDISVALTVHSLLVVDALQTFGPDFELLIASHKHVGMDSMSGSIRDSEPTSPTSPGSPDPSLVRNGATSPIALRQALSTLATTPPLRWCETMKNNYDIDTEALISIEVVLISGQEPLQIANIQFNNLDVIANQETIVELIGFVKRSFPSTSQKPTGINTSIRKPSSVGGSTESLLDETSNTDIGSTEITFDFHRLNILLLRGVAKDGNPYGKKICTATMSEAKIRATIGSNLEVGGSLGGLQVLDLTPEGQLHQRILSVGQDPLVETVPLLGVTSAGTYDDNTAFSFKVTRALASGKEEDISTVNIKMASLWYTHSPYFTAELQSCVNEFKQYLTNLARSIKSAATDMALGLVQARATALAHTLNMSRKIPSSIYGSAVSFSETSSPYKRKRIRSTSNDQSAYASAKDTIPQTPYSPEDLDELVLNLRLNIELDSPVLVLPRSSDSAEVFVAHLGKISISNNYSDDTKSNIYNGEYTESRTEHYNIEVKDMNVYSLDTSSRRVPGNIIMKSEVLYDSKAIAKPILHETKLKLLIDREVCKSINTRHSSESNLLLEGNEYDAHNHNNSGKSIQIIGSIVTALKLSLTRDQYEQILDTLEWFTSSKQIETQNTSRMPLKSQSTLTDINEEDIGVTTLNMDPNIRAKLFPTFTASSNYKKPLNNASALKITFDVPIFTIELRGENSIGESGLVDLSFQEFVFNYEKCAAYETNMQISLRSILMEDLHQPTGSRQRIMVSSATDAEGISNSACVSRSCPDVTYREYLGSSPHGSLPDHLESPDIFGVEATGKTNFNKFGNRHFYPFTPPPSPQCGRVRPENNLVIISILLVDSSAPNFQDYNGIQKSVSVDFNCLDLVINTKSWIVVLDFFNISSGSGSSTKIYDDNVDNSPSTSSKEKSVTNIAVKSLTVVLTKPDRDIAKVNLSKVEIEVKTRGMHKEVDGKLGSMSLQDLTLNGQLYKERFMTSGKQALEFQYVRHLPDSSKNYDAQLTLDMASVVYVHTKRFVAEILAFSKSFTEQQEMVMKGIQAATSGQPVRLEPLRLSLILEARSPIILLPVSSKSSDVLVVDLGQLSVTNVFKYSDEEGTISVISNNDDKKCLLDVMTIKLENMDLYAGVKDISSSPLKSPVSSTRLKLGTIFVTKDGPSLLPKKFQLKLQVEKNLNVKESHAVPDMSIYGHLSTLDGALDLKQYRLIRGLLDFNLGEDTEMINPSVPMKTDDTQAHLSEDWKLSSIKLEMQNVTLCLVKSHSINSPLARIHFIKSHLTVETYSSFCQDIDLVSREILIIDSRFNGSDTSGRQNVFTNILQPINQSNDENNVQAEIHSRKRQDYMKITILLNDIRLMAIFDWWESVREYIFQNISSSDEDHTLVQANGDVGAASQFDLKLNITDSEIVVVEDSSLRDTNAVILKSTTVMQYRPYNLEKPLSCSLSKCEMFSCILENKDETALSIIDPVTLNIEMNQENVLEVQLQFLMVRLSYHDMCMFMQILNSLPKQIFSKSEENSAVTEVIQDQISTLTSLGFQANDCLTALEKSGNRIDDAAIWLTLNATPSHSVGNKTRRSISIDAVEVKASRISVCIIDDCGDSDVPLLELSLSKLFLYQHLPKYSASNYIHPRGFIEGHLESDYYNRVLSGWEPFLEPWKCSINWERTISQVLWKNRLSIKVDSEESFNINITSTLIDLYKQVKDNWTKDYYNVRLNKNDNTTLRSANNFRRRSPFVPFALKNDTGSPLKFQTYVTDLDKSQSASTDELCGNWISVNPGELVPFSFTTRDKMRHQDSHKMRMHQLGVKVEGWQCLEPVTVDRVGVYFRDAASENQPRVFDNSPARVVFDITLEGSARKLVTIRSALLIINYLPQTVEVKLESRLPQDSLTPWVPSKSFTIDTKTTLSVPLMHTCSQINIRPSGSPHQYTFCMPSLSWTNMPSNVDRMYELATCHTHKGHNYRFCAEIVRENLYINTSSRFEQPAHRIHLLPTVKLENLLPIDMHYVVNGEVTLIKAGSNAALTGVDPEKNVELEIRLDNFRTCNPIVVLSSCTSDFTSRIRFEDNRQRRLYLLAQLTFNKGAKLKIAISAYYWIINRTGLPLVFRQSGTSVESAGQFDEHEQARMVAPLLFSFSDQDANLTINARVGKRVVWDGSPQWCANFHVQKGTQYRKLHVTMRDGRPDTVFIVGLEVRPGRGKYRSTSIITISPRYQLYNRSLYKLLFAQICSVKISESSRTSYLKALPNSHMPFHWTNLEKEQLLCVSIEDIPNCCWSGGLKIDTNNSMHVNIRDAYGHVYFLRLEVLLQGATFFIVFSDADTMPPPIRVDNFSEVSIMFGQSCYIDFMHSTARAHTSVPYAWDEPTKANTIRLIAPGGVSNNYDMSTLGSVPGLTYENFIYIAFAGTFRKPRGIQDPNDVESQELVLDVVKNTRVVLSHKIPSERSQLWRMTSEGYLQHEGSNPPLHPGQTQSRNTILVLDIEGTAPQPNTYSKLMLRRIDPRRRSTQKWRFTEDGKLCCDHYNMCVQALDGFYGLRPGNAAVLGLPQLICHKLTEQGIPIEHAIERQRLRPGSGFLSVSIQMDGPTQVISIKDLKEKKIYASPDDREWGTISKDQRPKLSENKNEEDDCRELQIGVNLKGLGMSLICRKPAEELVYAHFSTIIGETLITSQSKQFCISIKHIQVDNQLIDTSVPVVMYITPVSSKTSLEAYDHLPALDFNTEIQKKVDKNAVIFKHFILRLKKITIVIEERLLLKLCQFIGVHSQVEEVVDKKENDYNTQRLLSEVSAVHAKRYYFGVIKLIPDQIRLSVTTASKLPENLQRIKRKLGLTLIKFEDAAVELEAFERHHPFETSQFLFKSIVKHFKDELMWQAGIILGSVDFIGNPLGLVNDVSEGISGFIYEGNVGALVKNVTHGMSNSAAKITESLSDGLGKVTMDDCHEEMRQRIRQVQTGKSSDHILAGFKGLGFGILGGATGIFKQVYEGASNDGIQGVFSGLGKGLVGAVTKPVVGVLDLASETARAVRDSSRSKLVPERIRLPRCANGPGRLLPKYDFRQSQGQQYLYALNGKNFEEHLVAFQGLGSASEDIFCVVSDKMIRIVTNTRSPELTPVIECALGDLEICNVISEKNGNEVRYYIEIVMHYTGVSAVLLNPDPVKKPRVRCQTFDMALSVSQQINYARRMYIEHLYTLTSDNISTIED
ncbi:vacuolar protein sorting 13D [Leptinotarsa decemlineata]|uniref:vacuolar protein sorting 13D n=1 Tax=Leptinotarsa decemlineata TaxID=7539 RepID=UPI003D3045E9